MPAVAAQVGAQSLQDEDADVRQQVLWALTRFVDANDADLDYPELAEQLRRALKVDRKVARNSSE